MGGAAGAGIAGAAALALTRQSWIGLLSADQAEGQSLPPGKGILVLVTLYGGNDGLNTVIPYADSAYLAARPTLGYQPHEVLPLADGLGLHPNMKGLKGLWDAGQLAVVRGVGYPNAVLSHFRSMAIWQTASPDTPVVSGWLGRWLDATGSDPMRAISVGTTLPPVLAGEKRAGTAIAGSTVTLPGGPALAPVLTALDGPGPDRAGLGARVAASGADLLAVQHALADLLKGSATPGPAAPATSLAAQLDLVAQLIKAGSPTKVYQVSLGGFDNHAAEKDTHARLMGELDGAISGFMTSLKGSTTGDGVVLMTYSEFGRRVAQNASGGTDHGTAAPLFVVGRPVKGGRFYGDEPSLAALADGNLKFSTDFRSVYATVLGRVVGVDPKVALSGTFPMLDLV
jgi:uncharacterized protein (DUF1501 family)